MLQMVHGSFLSHKEMENAGAVASLSIPLTCKRKIPSLPKHSKPDSPDVGRVQSVESLKPVSVTYCLYGFPSEIAPSLNDAKELTSFSLNYIVAEPRLEMCIFLLKLHLLSGVTGVI